MEPRKVLEKLLDKGYIEGFSIDEINGKKQLVVIVRNTSNEFYDKIRYLQSKGYRVKILRVVEHISLLGSKRGGIQAT